MSDALCGPSNPLQQFKAQTSLDRTLQQDRLRSQASPAHQQGFRSHDPNAGLLDPEFEAFQAGHPPPPEAFHHGPPQAFAGRGGGGMHMGMGPAAPDWAADFQRMNLSSPPPPPAQQQHQPMPQGSGWAQSFQQHIAQSAPRAQSTASPSPLAFQQRARYGVGYGGMGFQSQFAPQHQQPMFGPEMQQGKGKEAVTDEIFDDAAFERAFEQARGDMMDESQAGLEGLQHSTEYRQDTSGELVDQIQREREIQEQLKDMRPELSKGLQDPAIQEANALEDLAQQPEQMEEEQQEKKGQDDDALAATAEELLNKVEHNKTDKFKNSQFLGLMRKLRDREVKVEGDQMVETTQPSSSAAAAATSSSNHPLSTSPLSKSTATNTTNPPLFDNSEQRPYPISPSTNTLHGPRVDSRPYDHFTTLPADAQQDADLHRFSPSTAQQQQQQQQPQDGQAVVDLLNEPSSTAGDDLGTWLPEGALFDDSGFPAFGEQSMGNGENASLTEMLYGHDGTLNKPVSWKKEGGSA
ncbi:hypothetical protein KC332_g15696 [Hortaea werneckii]|uniref:Peroxin 20 n=1 Tax=Hortaea werneckii EXF-2000 TaxID=1157616 RepID=A0A1Z5TMJ8_HORWE|nr:hypothetical protein KC358_g15771 [Hortaea werneckii]OTA37250.1 hypothetical protein BTJ68_02718 [Hortaea werneckii EXF-2000]KAI6801523.1 hypothetical protein KC350_g15622 [Hortaea werneckii]KAI6903356.1 hypothetical protein KC348_g15707 [Hortaea werneckii]KAI6938812.1 hypothetical protein KC341_g4641 [Hortaea werneckii]